MESWVVNGAAVVLIEAFLATYLQFDFATLVIGLAVPLSLLWVLQKVKEGISKIFVLLRKKFGWNTKAKNKKENKEKKSQEKEKDTSGSKTMKKETKTKKKKKKSKKSSGKGDDGWMVVDNTKGAKKVKTKWSCTKCSYINSMTVQECSMCGAPRKKSGKKATKMEDKTNKENIGKNEKKAPALSKSMKRRLRKKQAEKYSKMNKAEAITPKIETPVPQLSIPPKNEQPVAEQTPHKTSSKAQAVKAEKKKHNIPKVLKPKSTAAPKCPLCGNNFNMEDRQKAVCGCGVFACTWCWTWKMAETRGCPRCPPGTGPAIITKFHSAQKFIVRERMVDNMRVVKFKTHRNLKGLGSGDSWLLCNFLSKGQADYCFEHLKPSNTCEVEYQQMFSRPNAPIARLQVIQALNVKKKLASAFDGEEKITPRLLAFNSGKTDTSEIRPIYRYPVNNQQSCPVVSFSPTCERIRKRVERVIGQGLNHNVINLYRSKTDYIGFHSDKMLDIAKDSKITSISFGGEREMAFRKVDGSCEQRILLPHGSLLVIGPKTNLEWHHSIPKCEKEVNLRISLTIRHVATYLEQKSGKLLGQGKMHQTQNWPFFDHNDLVECKAIKVALVQDSVTKKHSDFNLHAHRIKSLNQARLKLYQMRQKEGVLECVAFLRGERIEPGENMKKPSQSLLNAVLLMKNTNKNLIVMLTTSLGDKDRPKELDGEILSKLCIEAIELLGEDEEKD